MLTQQLINLIVQDIAALWSLVPALPAGIAGIFSNIADFEFWMRGHLQALGVIVPWDTFEGLATVFVAIMALWIGALVIRGILWIVNR